MYKGRNKEVRKSIESLRFYPELSKQNLQISAEELKLRRQDLGLTQNGLAELFGVDRNTINRWENGLIKDVPKWVDLALQPLELEHAKEFKNLDREKKKSESGSTFVDSFFGKNE